jgi:hypothetical protein
VSRVRDAFIARDNSVLSAFFFFEMIIAFEMYEFWKDMGGRERHIVNCVPLKLSQYITGILKRSKIFSSMNLCVPKLGSI